MLFKNCLAFVALATAAYVPHKRQSALDTFVAQELPRALSYALGNIGGTNGTKVPAADAGIVVASPSDFSPNYFYTWTRDSALTYAMIVDELIFGNDSLRATVEDYTTAQAELQTVDNPSGTLWPAGLGLGEMKFFTNKTRFNEVWGRPQRDGPALRATVFLMISQTLMGTENEYVVRDYYWPLILNDIKYVGQYWNQTGYELWEEVHGTSFFTLNAQHRALTSAGYLASMLGQACEPCEQAPQIACLLQSFWNETGNYITADLNTNQITTRSGVNVSPLISSIQVFDPEASCNASDFQPCNSKILATHKVVVDSFRDIYPINQNATAPTAVAVGRYPEDNYYEGNPWYLCTLAAAELLYDAAAQFNRSNSLTIDNYSLAFFQDIYPSAAEQTYTATAMTPILEAMRTYADGFVEVVQTYMSPNGSMSEQFNRTTGEPLSAYDLTWSLASFVTMARRRSGDFPLSWGAENATAAPDSCTATSYSSTNNYYPVTALGAPEVNMSCMTEVLFHAYINNSGTNPFVFGNTSLFGDTLSISNEVDLIQPMDPGQLNSTDNQWQLYIYLPAGVPIEYQYALKTSNGTLYLQNTTQVVTPSACGEGRVTTEDSPGFPGGIGNVTET